jgi:glycosyltransferase involved in cell wall biosynthesis
MIINHDVAPVNYSDPWKWPVEERYRRLRKGEKKVVYYYDYPDSSTFRYRVYNMMQVLQESQSNISSTYFSFGEWDYLEKAIDLADVFVICRARYNHHLNRMVLKAHNKGKLVFFDVDDLVFNPAYAHLILDTLHQDPDNPNVWDYWFGYIGRLNATMNLCDRIITTNDFLAARIHEFTQKPVSVIPNFINREQMEISDRLYKEKCSRGFERSNQFTLGYFSGTPSHSKDLDIVTDALVQLLEGHSNVNLLLVGYIDIADPLEKFRSRIILQGLNDFVNLQRVIASAEINLVPLQNNIFTNCKSELKFFEAGIVGTITVASPTFTYSRSIINGENGFLAMSYEWHDKLESIINHVDSYTCLSGIAHQTSESKFAWYNQIKLVEETLFLRTEIQQNSAPEPL